MQKRVEGNRATVQITRKVNLGNYENVDITVGFDVEIGATEDMEAVAEELLDSCSALVGEHLKEYKKG